jgi:hypothetical protein
VGLSFFLFVVARPLSVVTLSIVLHGTSVKPLLALFWRRGA